METIRITSKFKIRDGNEDNFKKIVTECVVNAKKKETGMLQYDWFFNSEGNECVVFETYSGSDAVVSHILNVSDLIGQLIKMSEFELEIYGVPSAEMQKATNDLNPKSFSLYLGL